MAISVRDMLLYKRENEVAFILYLDAIVELLNTDDLNDAVYQEIHGTPRLFESSIATFAALIGLGYGTPEVRAKVLTKAVELRLGGG